MNFAGTRYTCRTRRVGRGQEVIADLEDIIIEFLRQFYRVRSMCLYGFIF
jgi:hypothetical protein